MTPPPVFSRPARREFEDAVDWYETRRAGSGAKFEAAVQTTLGVISADPRRYPIEYGTVRGAPVPGYPHYLVYYRAEPSPVTVVSVFHASRDPSGWQSRV